ncbi:MAG: PhnD/SsuA/transferrin family substrate-binding protein [Myxococcales bacterium]|nr:PhnD/SsuA/transferrin family substrate-binding protein [Myxococcales bacterium]
MSRFLVTAMLVLALASGARADTITVGVYAPSEPFPSTAARVELAKRLGDHLGTALGGTGVGRVYARAGDFSSAVKKGEVTVAVVDATYLAGAGGGYTVIAAATRAGDATHSWQLVARGADKIGQLKGKRVLVPSVGGREGEFVLNVLFGGEVGKDFFGKIEAAPDTASTLAALGLGKADAAVVPASVELPGGVTTVLALPQLSGPVLVAYGSVTAAQRQALAAAALAFKGDGTIGGFKGADGDAVKSIARRFSVPVKRGPHAVPAVRVVVGDLVEGRTFTIERTPATAFALAPSTR